MGYGRKIIDYLFKKRAERSAVCYERERKVQADSDRCDIRMFETGLPPQRYGDFGQSPRAAENAEGERLIGIAKAHNLYIGKEEWTAFGDRRCTATGESIVFLSKDGNTFTKLKSPFAKAAIKGVVVGDVIYEHLIHNILFPSTRYRFIGITEDVSGVRIVLEQRNIASCFRIPTQAEIDDFLIGQLRLKREDPYFYGNEYFSITDVSSSGDNVLCGEDGRLFFIDPIIKLKKPAVEVLDFLYREMCVE